ncbi:MAG: DUF937 domain-containing protein [Acidobacteriota bacterium]|nr:DUF937 domain-containing protein [Acidobacteriota bacterium]
MFSLQDLLGPERGSQAVDQISNDVGAEPSAVSSAIQAALPILMGGLANNASNPQGAESLNTALEQDHDGGILDNLGGLGGMIFGGGGQPEAVQPPRQADAGGILGHILGNNQGQVAEQVSNQSGLGMGQVSQILMLLAPIVMGYLGRQKREQNVGADGLGGLLGGILGGGQQAQPSGNPRAESGSFLDQDGDGSSMDDIASMAYKYMTNRS